MRKPDQAGGKPETKGISPQTSTNLTEALHPATILSILIERYMDA
jgi:hypothetical protein